jgi:hypothetical protein
VSRRNPCSASITAQAWRKLYEAALLEGDREMLPSRIADARRALLLRGRELSARPSDHAEEAEALNDALYALRMLSSCLELKTNVPSLRVLKYQGEIPVLACCDLCGLKFFPPSRLRKQGAEAYLRYKFLHHNCPQQTEGPQENYLLRAS